MVNICHLQLPLILASVAWVVTIHKAQGLTLNKLSVDNIGEKFSTGVGLRKMP